MRWLTDANTGIARYLFIIRCVRQIFRLRVALTEPSMAASGP